jgi:alkaline phosphatase
VIFGGGRSYFRPTTMTDEEGRQGRRRDGVDLIAEWQKAKTTKGATWGWAWDRASLETIDVANADYIMGILVT